MHYVGGKTITNRFNGKQDIGYLWQGDTVGWGSGRSSEQQPVVWFLSRVRYTEGHVELFLTDRPTHYSENFISPFKGQTEQNLSLNVRRP